MSNQCEQPVTTKDILNGWYAIHSDGRVFSYPKRNHRKGIFLKTSVSKRGYERITLKDKGRRLNIEVHRLVAQAFIPNPSNKPCVNHVDGNKLNNNILNLEWVTYSENSLHYFNVLRKGGHSKKQLDSARYWGRINGSRSRKLTIKQSEEVRSKYMPYKYSSYKLAKEYGVTARTILNIVNNKCYVV